MGRLHNCQTDVANDKRPIERRRSHATGAFEAGKFGPRPIVERLNESNKSHWHRARPHLTARPTSSCVLSSYANDRDVNGWPSSSDATRRAAQHDICIDPAR